MRSVRLAHVSVSVLSALLIVVSACDPSPFTPASRHTFPAQPTGCFVELLSRAPAFPHEKIGTFEFTNMNKWGAADRIDTADRLRELVGERACAAGANALITTTNDAGWYVKAVAIRWNPDLESAH